MIFKKDNFILGAILGFIGPLIGILIYKFIKLGPLTFKEAFQYMYSQPGHAIFSVSLSLALMINAVLFTVYVNTHKDKTAKGIFVLTLLYGLLVLSIKTFS